jgi:hypothetical protein
MAIFPRKTPGFIAKGLTFWLGGDAWHHPFGPVLVGPDDRLLMRQGNLDTLHHAETEFVTWPF